MNITFVDLPPHLCGELEECCIWVEGSKVSVELEDFENELSYEVQSELLKCTKDFIVVTNVDEETFEQYVATVPVVGTNERFVFSAQLLLSEYIDELLSHDNFEIV